MATTRFAPSPTGYLHIGHAFSAWHAWSVARSLGGRMILRIEDIDTGRCRPEFDAAILDDLAWLGLDWAGPVWRQSTRFDAYRAVLDRLAADGLLYPCFCTRREIQAEIARMGSAPHGPDGPLYPGTCRRLAPQDRGERLASGQPYAWRLDVAAAGARAGSLTWRDEPTGEHAAQPELLGDVVLGRKDTPASYHLAVVVDDIAQGVTHVTRGEDLFDASHLHRLLYALLGAPSPIWHHHGLIRDAEGRRLAKRSDSVSIRALREERRTPAEVWRLAGVDR